MNIVIRNCNNITKGNIAIEEGKLNIKYGINGTGKTTISKALKLSVDNDDLSLLKPFRSGNNVVPEVEISTELNSMQIYNDEYVSKYLFLNNGENLINNSFEVFIQPNNFNTSINIINSLLSELKSFVESQETIEKLFGFKNDMQVLIKSRNAITANAPIFKALNNGNKLLNIPQELSEYSQTLTDSELNIKWAKWFADGKVYIKNGKCPYCMKTLNPNFDDIKTKISETIEKKNVETLTKADSVLESIVNLLNDEDKQFVETFTNKTDDLSDDDRERFASIYREIENVCNIFDQVKTFNYFNLRTFDNLADKLNELLINENLLLSLNSQEIINLVQKFNTRLSKLITNIQPLQVEINILNSAMNHNVRNNLKSINDFLDTLGMDYNVGISENDVILTPKNIDQPIDPNNHLSWGEKNCFALALFMFDCIKNNYDLIILDDPVSSFDMNKKYAIMHYLFKTRENNLRNKTVLMFTHDLEPIINYLKINNSTPDHVVATYIENNQGEIIERDIYKDDIESIINVSKACISNNDLNIINRLVHLRRFLELDNNYNEEYNLLSTLFKGNVEPKNLDGTLVSEEEKLRASNSIIERIAEFNYDLICSDINDLEYMKRLYNSSLSNYEKIELFRIINSVHNVMQGNTAIEKFINESFHIENSYIFQLDPYAYNHVPNYIIAVCDSIINGNDGNEQENIELAVLETV